MVRKSTGEADPETVRYSARPIGLIAAALIFWDILWVLGVVGVAALVLVVAVKLVFAYAVAWLAWAIVDLMAAASLRKAERTELSVDNMIIPLLRRSAKLLIAAFTIIYTLSALEINLVPVLGSVGLAGLAISFAAQDMIRNLFGGVTIFLDKPFKSGDRVRYQGYDGFVEKVGFRSTKVRTLIGHLVTIPNGGLTGDAVENISSRATIRRDMNVTIPLDTSRHQIEHAVEIIRGILEEDGVREHVHPLIDGSVLQPRVYFNDINTESLNIRAIYWYAPPEYWDYMAHCQRVNLRIAEEFEHAGIRFAIPARKIHFTSEPQQEMALKSGPAAARSG